MTPLERAARALHDDTRRFRAIRDPAFPTEPPIVQQSPFIEWDALPIDARERYYGQVHAVLQAVREPSEGMVGAGERPFQSEALTGVRRVWEAMIDAALEEA